MGSIARRRLNLEVRRQQIIEAAERLLKQNGPDVRVEDVEREAAAAKGTFYLYFPTWG
jgi:AcrR family transcriptional regulator